MNEDILIELCNQLLLACPYYSTASLLGRAYYRDKSLYHRYDKAYAFVDKQRQLILQSMKH